MLSVGFLVVASSLLPSKLVNANTDLSAVNETLFMSKNFTNLNGKQKKKESENFLLEFFLLSLELSFFWLEFGEDFFIERKFFSFSCCSNWKLRTCF